MNKYIDHHDQKGGVNPFVVGAIMAAGAAALTYYFSHDDNRHKIDDTITKAKDKAKNTYYSLRGRVDETKDKFQSKTPNQNLSV